MQPAFCPISRRCAVLAAVATFSSALVPAAVSAKSKAETDGGVGQTLKRFMNHLIGKKAIIGFFLNNQGLMYNLTLEGSKFTCIGR